jgi:hypothetical protein
MSRAGVLCGFVAAVAGCGGADPATGITAYLRATNAQFVEGGIGAATGDAPIVHSVNLANTTIYPGLASLPMSGTVEGGYSVMIGLSGDSGHWILPAPLPDPVNPKDFGFATQLGFSPLVPTGKHTLVVQGVGENAVLGPPLTLALTAGAPGVAGALVFTLTWDTNVDLDLHVLIPNPFDPGKPVEIWSKAPLGLAPPGPADPPYDDATALAAPHLDRDSNGACVVDGIRQENVIFPNPPPAGEYIVRVDAFSMCGQVAAQWRLEVNTPDGQVVNPATWESTEVDTRGAHGVGAGRLAVQFSL